MKILKKFYLMKNMVMLHIIKKPNDIYEENRIYIYSHRCRDFDINEFTLRMLLFQKVQRIESQKKY